MNKGHNLLFMKIIFWIKTGLLTFTFLIFFLPWVFLMINTYSYASTNCRPFPKPPIVYKNKQLCKLVFGEWREKGNYYEGGGVSIVKYPHCRTKKFISGLRCDYIYPKDYLDSKEAKCNSAYGNWLSEYNECEMIYLSADEGKLECDKLGGTFYPCPSACRHDSKTTLCLSRCVPVCAL